MSQTILAIFIAALSMGLLCLVLKCFVCRFLLSYSGFATRDVKSVSAPVWRMLADDLRRERKMWFQEYVGALKEIAATDYSRIAPGADYGDGIILNSEFNREIEISIMVFQFMHLGPWFEKNYAFEQTDREYFMQKLKSESLATPEEFGIFADIMERYSGTEPQDEDFSVLADDMDTHTGNYKYPGALAPFAYDLIIKTRITMSHYCKDQACIQKLKTARETYFCPKEVSVGL